ncbi:Immunoglobulin superfamily member 10 [Trichoplax sp. H2]|nr:Immunoglobulin superfamily member 10 [Trichoplax sp. H2]|eukprot:RDD37288.1 Immunoglobulin superfamily member 10 [Trichoplax sp. H2]
MKSNCLMNVSCPSECVCETSVIKCTLFSMHSVPIYIRQNEDGSKFEKMVIKDTSVKELRKGNFVGYSGLKYLDLYKNDINYIEGQSFAGMSALKKLDISSNFITMLSPEMFYGLAAVTEMALDGNKIDRIDPMIFYYNKNLTNLGLKYNRIRHLTPAFTTLKRLKILQLSNNPLVYLPHAALFGLMSLDVL